MSAPSSNMASSFAQMSPAKLAQLQTQLPDILTDAEKLLPEDKRNEVFREKMLARIMAQGQHKMQQQQQQQQGAGMGMGMQSPMMGMQQGMQNAKIPVNQSQLAYQEQLRHQLQQQQQQQQQHLAMQSRLQQQAAAAQQGRTGTPRPAQPMTPMPQGPINTASPQSHGGIGSPQVIRQSPSTAPGRPVGMPMQGIKTLIENFPKLLELKRQGKLKPEQERLFDQFMSSAEGQNHLREFRAHQARLLVERGLTNPVAHPAGLQPQQTPAMNNMQLPLAAQQQLAALQQQQQQPQQNQQSFSLNPQAQNQNQLAPQFAQNLAGAGGNQTQLTPQQMQALQMQRLAAAQMQAQAAQNGGRAGMGGGGGGQGLAPNQAMINQAALARAAQQAQAQQSQNGMMGMSPHIAAQSQAQGQSPGGFGSPRPGARPPMSLQQMLINIQPSMSRVAPDKVESVKAMLMRLANMSDEERDGAFKASPQWIPLWNRATGGGNPNPLAQQAAAQAQVQAAQQAHAAAQAQVQAAQAAAAVQAQMNGSSPHVGVGLQNGTPIMRPGSTPAAAGGFNGLNNVSNLHIPAGKARGLQGQGQGVGVGSPNMRLLQPAGDGQQQLPPGLQADPSIVQRLLEQGIPVQQAAQVFARHQQQLAAAAAAAAAAAGGNAAYPGLAAQHPGGGTPQPQRNITPAMLLAQYSHDMPSRPPPSRPEQIVPDAPAPTDQSLSILSRASWAPNYADDVRVESMFRPQTAGETGSRTVGRGTLGWRRVEREGVDDWPEGLREAVDEEAEEEEGEEGEGKGRASGMPGQKRRKVQEVAEEVDKALRIPKDSETLLLELFDEHSDVVSEASCMLAKHRKATTLDRKDIQLSWELLYGRIIPGFSSDRIRQDQTKSAARHRQPNPAYTAKLKAVNEGKAAWRRERKRAKVEAAALTVGVGVVEEVA
ncbi:hypothetical protein L202_06754 [Cryptococcus amylolentus CBS 6039]|uniref:Transcription initiation factor TFIID subunit 12 domain-containing protein n=1 Tax=Cryptococcus amylolentus CBS 6039 TaxID=1295533 RepID=A0A1E3HDA9_9TREE|nr:hypothetical protein L202_06754 [Cryptococcus amylolentus CBS 6039]ODN74338.1 hypothetical protein L202_06754 [Cryptococcus amylolentus CBS 6039]